MVLAFDIPAKNRMKKKHQGVHRRARKSAEGGEGPAGYAHDGAAPEAVGQPSHRSGAEHEEHERRSADGGDGPVAYPEALPDVGTQDGHRAVLQFVEAVQGQQNKKRSVAALEQAFFEGRLLAAHTGQQIVGEQHLGLLGITPSGLALEHRRGQSVDGLALGLLFVQQSPRRGGLILPAPVHQSSVRGSWGCQRQARGNR